MSNFNIKLRRKGLFFLILFLLRNSTEYNSKLQRDTECYNPSSCLKVEKFKRCICRLNSAVFVFGIPRFYFDFNENKRLKVIDYSLIAGVYKKTIQSLILVKVLNSEAISFIITDCETCMSIESKNKISLNLKYPPPK